MTKLLIIEGRKFIHVFSTDEIFTYSLYQKGVMGLSNYTVYKIEERKKKMTMKCPQCDKIPTMYRLTYTCDSQHEWQENVLPPITFKGTGETTTIDTRKMLMPFGKHKGTAVEDLPLDYIEWVLGNVGNLRDDLREEIEAQVTMKKGGGVVRKEGKISGTTFHYGKKE